MTNATPLTDWPSDHSKYRINVFAGPDGYGRSGFDCLWWQDGKPRGQVFRSNVETFIERQSKRGWQESA